MRRSRTAGETRDVLLDVSARLFRQHGYESSSLKALGAEVGVSPSAMYWHFSSKSDLLFAVVERTLRRFHESAAAAMDGSGDAPAPRVRAFVRFYVRTQLNESVDVDAYASFQATARIADYLSPEAVEQLLGYERAVFALLRTTISDGVAAGAFRAPAPASAAFAIIGMCESVQTWYRHGGATSVDGVADQYADYALAILRAPLDGM